MDDGYQTLITFARNPVIAFWEKSVTPPGMDGGDEIDTTTMHNVRFRTFASRALITLTEGSVTAAWDPDLYDEILLLLNENDVITITFPDGSTLAFWGFLKSFEPDEFVEGEQPTATITYVPTNQDNTGVERAPVMVEVAGT
jgi:hypothetical protein